MAVVFTIMVPHPPIIVPAIGGGEEKKIQKTSKGFEYVMRELVNYAPDTIIITSPHSVMYSDYFHISPHSSATGDLGRFGAPQETFSVTYDTDFVAHLVGLSAKESLPAGILGEKEAELDHGITVPFHFLQKAFGGEIDAEIVRISLSGLSLLDHYHLGKLIQKTANDLGRRTAIIASGDLSHRLKEDGPYGYVPEGPEYDKQIMDVMHRGAFEELFDFSSEFLEQAAECGHRSFVIMAGALDGMGVNSQALSYEGPFGVGYGIAQFVPTKPDKERRFLDKQMKKEQEKIKSIREKESPYVTLARNAYERYVTDQQTIKPPADLPEELLNRQAGAFVTLKKHGQLRGCIGTIFPTRATLAEEIIHNAISAATQDNRFPPVDASELSQLVCSVDVLSSPEAISSPEELDLERYGVIVTHGHKRGLLLPNLEGISSVEEQVDIARDKAGISPEDEYSLERFEVIRHV